MKSISQLVVPLLLLSSLPSLATDNLTAFQRGDFELAVKQLESTLLDVRFDKTPAHYIDVSVRLAIAYQKLGLLQKAKSILQPLESRVRQKDDPVRYATVQSHLSDIYLAIGRSQEEKTCMTQKASQQKASSYINKALEVAQAHRQPRLLANVLNKQANLLMAQNKCDQALLSYYESLQEAQKLKDKPFETKIWMNIVQAIVQSGDYDFAQNKFEQSVFELFTTILQQLQTLPDSHDKAFSLLGLTRLMRQLQIASDSKTHLQQAYNNTDNYPTFSRHARGNMPLPPLLDQEIFTSSPSSSPIISETEKQQLEGYIYNTLQQAFEIAKTIQDIRAMSYAKGYLGQLYEDAKRYDEALQLTRQALFYAQQHHYYPELLYRWQWQLGRIFKTQGLPQLAISAYQQARDYFKENKVRDSLKGGYRPLSQSFRNTTGALYFQLTDLFLQQARLEEAQESLEEFKQAELRDYFRDECLFERQGVYEKTKIHEALPKQTAVLYLIVLENRIELLLKVSGNVQVPIPPSKVPFSLLQWEVEQFRKKLTNTSYEITEIQDHAKTFYQWLIEPIANTLKNQQVKTLVIVPDGILLTIPFAALHDGQEYLINKDYVLVVTPTLEIPDLTPMPRENLRILLGGYSKATQVMSQTFQALENVPKELEAIREQLGNHQFQFTILTEEQFILPKLQAELKQYVNTKKPYRIIHFATHGDFDTDPNNPFLVIGNQSAMTMNQLRDLIGITALKNPIDLLTLSACQTALGNDRAALGLAGIALKARARSAVASLWLVDDPATAELMPKFYFYLKDNKRSKAQALQQAQRYMLTTAEYSHPYYWAAFLFIGNWL